MALTNLDFIVITLFFAITFLIAYRFRHKNTCCKEFLWSNYQEDKLTPWIGNFGIIEVILYGSVAASIGLGSIYYAFIGIFVAILLWQFIMKPLYSRKHTNDFNSYISQYFGKLNGIVIALFSGIICLFLVIMVIIITFKVLQSLLGWSYVNSIVGILGLSVICMLTGGNKGVYYNKMLQSTFVICVFLLVVVVSLSIPYEVTQLRDNLHQLAINQKLDQSYYLNIYGHKHYLSGLVIAISGFCGLTILRSSLCYQVQPNVKQQSLCAILSKILVVVLFVITGVIALGTSITPTTNANGEHIVTIEAQLPDGQTGYIVKSMDEGNQSVAPIPGIIPPIINPETNLVEKNSYDYSLANIIVFKHYLPHKLLVLLIVMIMALFMFSLADYLMIFSRICLPNILNYLPIVRTNGDEGGLWASRITITVTSAVVLCVAYFLVPYFNLFLFSYILIAILLVPLLAILMLSLWVLPNLLVIIPLLIGVALAVILTIYYNPPSQLDKYALISLINFALVFLSGIILNLVTSKKINHG